MCIRDSILTFSDIFSDIAFAKSAEFSAIKIQYNPLTF